MAQRSEPVQQRTAGGVSYFLVRRSVKNINLRVRRDGTAAASASPRVPAERVDAFVAEHADWICRTRARIAARAELETAAPTPDRAAALAAFTALSRQVFPAFETALNGQFPAIKVRDMKSRWGVCAMQKRQITFALRLAAMPLPAQEYVVVHEFCHFLVPNHSPAFWREVERLLPDWKTRRRLLR